MKIDKAVLDTIAALRSERGPLAARLDSIDLAIENLTRVYALRPTEKPVARQPRKAARPKLVVSDSAAAERRDAILSLIVKSEMGLTMADIRKQTPRMDPKARTNAIQILRTHGKIRRAGNAWVKAA